MSRAVIDPYLKIQAALADDSMDGVKANAGNIATAATALGAPAMKIDTTAVQLASAAEIERRARQVRRAERGDRHLHDRPAPDGARRA